MIFVQIGALKAEIFAWEQINLYLSVYRDS
jgi:hypothetical protein